MNGSKTWIIRTKMKCWRMSRVLLQKVEGRWEKKRCKQNAGLQITSRETVVEDAGRKGTTTFSQTAWIFWKRLAEVSSLMRRQLASRARFRCFLHEFRIHRQVSVQMVNLQGCSFAIESYVFQLTSGRGDANDLWLYLWIHDWWNVFSHTLCPALTSLKQWLQDCDQGCLLI